MSQDNDVMKQLTDMLYTDVIQKLEPPLPEVPSTDTNEIDTEEVTQSQPNIIAENEPVMPPLPPTEEVDEEGSEFQDVEGEIDEEGSEFQDVEGEIDEEGSEFQDVEGEVDEEGSEFQDVEGEIDEEGSEFQDVEGELDEEGSESQDAEGEVDEETDEAENDKEEETVVQDDVEEETPKQEEKTIQVPGPSIKANEFSFEDIIADDELNLEGRNEEQQKQIITAALAALIASVQEPTIEEKQSEELNEKEKQNLINVALASLIASKQKDPETTREESPDKKIIEAALAALIASKQKEPVEIKDEETQQKIVNAALAALIGSKIKADEKVPSKSYFRGISMPDMGSVKNVMKDLYKNIPTLELPKFTSNIFEGLLEPDLDYYEVPEEIRSKIDTQYNDYKVVAIKCSKWDGDKKCNDKDGKYYLYTSKNDKPKMISLDLAGNEIK
jgi:hypothetical protein